MLSCAVHVDVKELFRTVRVVHEETGKSRAWVFFDMVKCGFRYGAGFNDYLLCEFYHLTEEQRATYVTRSVNNALVALLNDKRYYHVFDNKNEFYTTFSDCLGRGWLNFAKASYEDFSGFMSSREEIMVKPDAESGGKGVKKLRKSEYPDLRQMYLALRAENTGVVEDVIVQHPAMAALHPESLNTLRVVTVLNGKARILSMPMSALETTAVLWITCMPEECALPSIWKQGRSNTRPMIKAGTPIMSIPVQAPGSRALKSRFGGKRLSSASGRQHLCRRCVMWGGMWALQKTARFS